jgi:NAD(P)-dependent dehydrogenase (short-subunit alcohol dehydrogenase family)
VDRLVGRVALVTGGVGGIGRATARRLADEGAAVMVTDVRDVEGEAVAAELRDAGRRAAYLHHDVTSEQEWRRAVQATLDAFGGLDVLVNNAGLSDGGGVLETTDLAVWNRSIEVLQTGVFVGMKCAAEALKRSAHASVVNVSSISGLGGGFGTAPAYHAAKAAVRILTKTVAVQWATAGIRVNSVHPGFIDTPLLGDALQSETKVAALLAETPMRRLGRADEVAAGIAYLAGDDASFVTGCELVIDGGVTAR